MKRCYFCLQRAFIKYTQYFNDFMIYLFICVYVQIRFLFFYLHIIIRKCFIVITRGENQKLKMSIETDVHLVCYRFPKDDFRNKKEFSFKTIFMKIKEYLLIV